MSWDVYELQWDPYHPGQKGPLHRRFTFGLARLFARLMDIAFWFYAGGLFQRLVLDLPPPGYGALWLQSLALSSLGHMVLVPLVRTTPGKRLCALYVESLDGGRAGWKQALRRELIWLLNPLLFWPALGGVASVMMSVRTRWDRKAGTRVRWMQPYRDYWDPVPLRNIVIGVPLLIVLLALSFWVLLMSSHIAWSSRQQLVDYILAPIPFIAGAAEAIAEWWMAPASL